MDAKKDELLIPKPDTRRPRLIVQPPRLAVPPPRVLYGYIAEETKNERVKEIHKPVIAQKQAIVDQKIPKLLRQPGPSELTMNVERIKEKSLTTQKQTTIHQKNPTLLQQPRSSGLTMRESVPLVHAGSGRPFHLSDDEMSSAERRLRSKGMMGMQNVDVDYLKLMEKHAVNIVDPNEEWD